MATLSPRLRRIALIALLAGVMVWAYARTAEFGTVYEDKLDVASMSTAMRPVLFSIVTPAWVGSRQIPLLSYQITGRLGGGPRALHLTNIAIHLLNGLLLVWWLMRSRAERLAMPALSVFWLHPLQSEAVSYVTSRSELFCALGFLIGLVSLTAWVTHRRLAIAGLCLGVWIAVGSKELGVMVPFALALVAWASTRAHAFWRSRVVLYGAAVALVGALVVFPIKWAYYSVVIRDYVSPTYRHLGYASLQSCVAIRTWERIVWPVGFQVSRSCEGWWPPLMLASLLALMVLVGWAAWRLWQDRANWTVLAIAVTAILWLPRWLVPTREFITEHHTYLPMIFVSIAVATWWQRLVHPRPGVS